MKLYNLNKHPRDEHIRFDEGPHLYYVNDKQIKQSVTKVVHDQFPSFDANKIARNLHKKHFEKDGSKYFNMSVEDIISSWDKNKNEACDLGTNLHKSIELFYNDEEVNNDSIEFEYFKNFNNDYSHLVPYRTEWEVYHEEANIAGSIDMIYKNKDGSLSIYDWKRSKKIEKTNNFEFGLNELDHLPNSNFWTYGLQLNIYKYILEEKYNEKIREMCLVVLHPNNKNYLRIELPNLQNEVKTVFANLINM